MQPWRSETNVVLGFVFVFALVFVFVLAFEFAFAFAFVFVAFVLIVFVLVLLFVVVVVVVVFVCVVSSLGAGRMPHATHCAPSFEGTVLRNRQIRHVQRHCSGAARVAPRAKYTLTLGDARRNRSTCSARAVSRSDTATACRPSTYTIRLLVR